MKRIALFITGLLLLLTRATSSYAQPTTEGEVKSLVGIEVHFRFDNSNLDFSYMGNDCALTRFAHVIDSLGLHAIDSVVIVSQSSPEGRYEHNLKLSRQRAATMREAIEQRHPELSSRLYVHPDGESWAQLRAYVKSDRQMKQETIDQVIDIIDADVSIDTKKWRLEQLPIYRYLLLTYYPRIRNSVFCIIYFDNPIAMAQLDELLPTPSTRAEVEALTLPSWSIAHSSQLMAQSSSKVDEPLLIKTNLVNDALFSPNIEIEYRINPHWSMMADYSIAWWSQKSVHWYYQLMQFNPEVRYWFRADRPWHGHYVGAFVGGGYYDLENGHRGYKGEHILAGLCYGYMFPITKHLSLDAGFGVGGMVTEYEEYLPMDGCYVYQQTSRTQYLGPLKLRLSLSWRIERQQLHKAIQWLKGGAR